MDSKPSIEHVVSHLIPIPSVPERDSLPLPPLPHWSTPLVGREHDITAIAGMLRRDERDSATDAASLKRRLSPAEFARAWDAGKALSPAKSAADAFALAADLTGEEHVYASADALTVTIGIVAVPSPATAVDAPSPVAGLDLTPRELEVLCLLAEGMSDWEIAESLSIGERTDGSYVQHAMQKIGVESRTAAAVFAVRYGLD